MPKFYTQINQGSTYCNIDISLSPPDEGGGRLAARKQYDIRTGELLPAVVAFDVKFNPHPVSKIGDVIEWIEAARDIAQRLDELIKTRDDFDKQFSVVQSGLFLRLVEAERSK